MATYTVTAPNGKTYTVTGPAGASHETVVQQILAQHPEAAQSARPVLSAKPTQRTVPASSYLGAIGRSVRNYALPGAGYVQAAGNLAGSALGLNNTKLNYLDRVREFQKQNEAQADTDWKENPSAVGIGATLGAVGGAIGGGALVKSGAAALAASNAPKVAAVGNFLQRMATAQKGAPVANAVKAIGQGAVGGAVYGAGAADPNQAGTGALTGAATGAVLAPVAGLVGKAAGALPRAISRPFSGSLSKAAKEVIQEDPGAIAARLKDLQGQTGAPVPVVAGLNPQDFGRVVDKVLKRSPDAAEAAQGHTGKYVRNFMDRMLGHVNNAGEIADVAGTPANGPGGAWKTTVGDLTDLRKQTADDLMQPIRHQQIDLSGLSLTPDEISLLGRTAGGNRSTDIPGQPGLGARLSAALGSGKETIPLNWGDRQPIPATLGEMDRLRVALSGAAKSDPQNAAAIRNMSGAISDFTKANLPQDVADGYSKMLSTYGAHSRIINGFETAASGQVPSDITDEFLRSDLASPEGKVGLSAGELYRQRQAAAASPASAINQTRQLAAQGALTRPSSISADAAIPGTVTSNLGDQASAGLADASQGESQVLGRMLDTNNIDPTTIQKQEALSPEDLARAAFLPHMLPLTKAHFIGKILKNGLPINSQVASNLADKLYSSDPTDVQTAMNALKASGMTENAIASIMGESHGDAVGGVLPNIATPATAPGQVAGQVAANAGAQALVPTPPPSANPNADMEGGTLDPNDPNSGLVGTVTDDGTGKAPDPAAPPAPADPNAPAAVPGAVTPASSPYMAELQGLYNGKASPQTLQLVDAIAHKESGNQHFDKNGKAKISSAGDVGLMQMDPANLPGLNKAYGIPVDTAALHNDPAYNKLAGTYLVDQLLSRYGGDRRKAAAAYNSNPAHVDAAIAADPNNWSAHLPKETQDYIGDL